MYTSTSVRESQPDWLTVGSHSARNVRGLADLSQTIRAQELADGNREYPWRLLGYQGYRCGRVRYGEARGWAITQLSGDLAASYLEAAYDTADSVSRLDLAVTIQLDQPDNDVGMRVYMQAVDFCAEHPKAAKPWFIGGIDSGWTTYIGQRQSDLYFRCYDKHAESRDEGDGYLVKQYTNAWRFELECKAATAEPTLKRLLAAANLSDACNGMVRAYLESRGVTPPWDADAELRPIGTLRRRSDRDRKLDWLHRQVRPTVDWLSQNGGLEAVYTALGLNTFGRT